MEIELVKLKQQDQKWLIDNVFRNMFYRNEIKCNREKLKVYLPLSEVEVELTEADKRNIIYDYFTEKPKVTIKWMLVPSAMLKTVNGIKWYNFIANMKLRLLQYMRENIKNDFFINGQFFKEYGIEYFLSTKFVFFLSNNDDATFIKNLITIWNIDSGQIKPVITKRIVEYYKLNWKPTCAIRIPQETMYKLIVQQNIKHITTNYVTISNNVIVFDSKSSAAMFKLKYLSGVKQK